ncbi:glycolate oxidase iron-sulfur subunit [Nitrosomonas ureae]|uniref:Glycolate oxidase iron-sulfur subunit n=1 Tax=Nitrosomonas ureae TaxID=44577 RepID=A0A1H5XBU6_9PROT|nr:glycolate oxidase iron-sulfur subunit [Nitrosomonas ureae]
MNLPSSPSLRDFVNSESNQCVSCGLCLPHCPTYRLLKSEADSPRGRINLMNGFVNGRIPLNVRFIQHMDRCLTCRACEVVCPNNVAYGNLIDSMRALIADQPKSVDSPRKLFVINLLKKQLLNKPARLDRLRGLFYFVQKNSWLRRIRELSNLGNNNLVRFVAQLPLIKFPHMGVIGEKHGRSNFWKEIYPAINKKRGEVGLFLGCVARLTDVATLNSCIYVLNHLGYTVYVPADQVCCGAIYQHDGAIKDALALSRQNKSAFARYDIDAIISTASGCGAQLLESRITNGHTRIVDISQFLIANGEWGDVNLAALPEKILVHEPCSQRNVLQEQAYPYKLIELIPGVQVVPLPGNNQCCGAAGTYFLDQPDIANMLLNEKISALEESGARYLVTSNIGCAMHFSNRMYEDGMRVEVLHPITLLARQMGFKL